MIQTNAHVEEMEAESKCQFIASVPVKIVSNMYNVNSITYCP